MDVEMFRDLTLFDIRKGPVVEASIIYMSAIGNPLAAESGSLYLVIGSINVVDRPRPSRPRVYLVQTLWSH